MTLIAILAGAIVSLLAVLLSLVALKSMLTSSERLVESLWERLETEEKSRSLERTIRDAVDRLEKLDVTVGNLYQTVHRRTMLERPLQVGEAPPGSPGMRFRPSVMEPPPEPSPMEGLAEPPTKGQSVGEQVRARAFGEPT